MNLEVILNNYSIPDLRVLAFANFDVSECATSEINTVCICPHAEGSTRVDHEYKQSGF